jgi:hypothetical protein
MWTERSLSMFHTRGCAPITFQVEQQTMLYGEVKVGHT